MNKEVFQNAVIQTHYIWTLQVRGKSYHPLHNPGQGGTRPLTLKLPIERSIHSLGILNPVLSKPLRYASYLFSPKQATSPVLAISTPSMASAPAKRENENWGTLKHKGGKVNNFVRGKSVATNYLSLQSVIFWWVTWPFLFYLVFL